MPVKKMIAAAVCTMMIFLVPLAFYIGRRDQEEDYEQGTSTVVEFKRQEVEEDAIKVEVLNGEEIVDMTMHDYLIGVVAAEMSAGYPKEALKAQAIAARTYTLYKMNIRISKPESASHEEADVCTDFSHCQSYADKNTMQKKWGDDYEKYLKCITDAVEETDGMVVTYRGSLISALFHAVSSGKTESAEDVWGTDFPYLQSVDSHWDTESKGYSSELSLSMEAFTQKVKEEYPDAIIPETVENVIGKTVKSDAGGIKTVEIMGIELTGKQLRNLFELRSTNITFSYSENEITMSVLGYGHGVGLSQDGAKGMAEEGYTAEEILLHYYTGCEVTFHTFIE